MPEQLALIASAQAERDRIIAHLAANHRAYLELVRGVAREIALRSGSVDVDLVHVELVRRELPLPAEIGADARILGALFCKREFVAIGQHVTTRAARIARAGAGASHITTYRLRAQAEG